MQVYYQTPINEQFTDSYSQRGLQPSTGGVTPIRSVTVEYKNADPTKRRGGKQEVRKLGATAQKATGYGMQAAGAGMQAGGKATKAGGRAATSAGAALSSTGVGAVVGVPLAVAGGAAQVAGTGMDAAGKATRKAGKAVSRTRRTKKIVSAAKAPTAALGFFGMIWPLGLWFWIQVPFAILSIFFLAVTEIVYRISQNVPAEEDRTIFEAGVAIVLSAAQWVANQVFNLIGININEISPAPFMMLGIYVCLAIGITTLTIMSISMKLSGKHPFLGKGATIKILALIVAIIGYSFPFFNLFPWYIPWRFAVGWSSK